MQKSLDKYKKLISKAQDYIKSIDSVNSKNAKEKIVSELNKYFFYGYDHEGILYEPGTVYINDHADYNIIIKALTFKNIITLDELIQYTIINDYKDEDDENDEENSKYNILDRLFVLVQVGFVDYDMFGFEIDKNDINKIVLECIYNIICNQLVDSDINDNNIELLLRPIKKSKYKKLISAVNKNINLSNENKKYFIEILNK